MADYVASADPGIGQGSADAIVQLRGIVQNLSALVAAFKGRPVTGTFTMTATATLVVPQPAVLAASGIQLQPTNAAAGTLQGSAKNLYISAIVPGTSFTVATASAAAATGGETFSYLVTNPT